MMWGHKIFFNKIQNFQFFFSSQFSMITRKIKIGKIWNLVFLSIQPIPDIPLRVLEPGDTLDKHAKRILIYIHPPHIICRGCLKELYFEWNPPCHHLYPICNLFATTSWLPNLNYQLDNLMVANHQSTTPQPKLIATTSLVEASFISNPDRYKPFDHFAW